MKKLLLLLALCLFSSPAVAQGQAAVVSVEPPSGGYNYFMQSAPPLTIREVDGSPSVTNATRFILPNGSLTQSGSQITLAFSSSFSSAVTVTSNSSSCFAVGPNGTTDPTLSVNCSTASAATGLQIRGRASGAGLDFLTTSPGSNENIRISAKGTGAVYFPGTGGAGTPVIVGPSTAAAGASAAGPILVLSNITTAPTAGSTDASNIYNTDAAAGDSNTYIRNEAGEVNRLTGLAARNSAQFDVTSSTTLVNVTGLTRNVESGRVYGFRAYVQTTANVAGGVKLAVGGTATATAISYEGTLTGGAALVAQTRATALAATVCASTTTTTGTCTIEGVIQVNAGGTLTIQFAQNASNGAASSVLANQMFHLIPIN